MCNQDYYRYIAELKGGDEAVATAAKANQEALNSVQVGPRDATVLDAPWYNGRWELGDVTVVVGFTFECASVPAMVTVPPHDT